MTDPSVSARQWPQKLSPTDRERVLLEILDGSGWMDTAMIHIAAKHHEPNFKVAPGTTRSILDRLEAAGRCERNSAGWFRAVEFKPNVSTLRKPVHGGYPGRLLPLYQPIHRKAAADPRSRPPLPSRLGARW